MRVECIDCDFHKFLGYTDLTAYIGGWLQANNVPNSDAASGYSGYNTSVRGPLGGTVPGLCKLALVVRRGSAGLCRIAAMARQPPCHAALQCFLSVTTLVHQLLQLTGQVVQLAWMGRPSLPPQAGS